MPGSIYIPTMSKMHTCRVFNLYIPPDPNSLAYDFRKYPALASGDYAATYCRRWLIWAHPQPQDQLLPKHRPK